MIILRAEKINRAFITNVVLEDVNFILQDKQRVGLVGVNGSGKSTLLRILIGSDMPDSGFVYVQKGLRVGYHAQLDDSPDADNPVQIDWDDAPRTVWKEMESVFEPVFDMERRLREMEHQMGEISDSVESARLAEDYDRTMRAFEDAGGYSWQSSIRGVLAGLGLQPSQYEQPLNSLSGGERTRVKLAKLLLYSPDILLLDEPTNHLDLTAAAWLEGYLRTFAGAAVIVSHDRYFMDAVCNGIAELSLRHLTQYEGNYSEYMEKREAALEQKMRQYNLQQKYIEREKMIIRRFRAFATEKAIRRAQSREKRLEKVDLVERPLEERASHFSFRIGRSTGNDVLIAENLSKAYDGRALFKGIHLHLRAGDRMAIIGPNGAGKTTLLRLLMRRETPDSGLIRYGSGVQVGYYDQQQKDLHEDKTVLDEVWDDFPRMEQTDIRSVLGGFLLSGDDVFQPIHTLSGGERGRVLLTKLMLRQDNFLILDEPTNHLDMDSRAVLEDALLDFEGTILAVSHDRFFINRLFNRVLALDETGATEYLGTYDDYIEKLKARNAPTEESVPEKTKTAQREEKKREREAIESARRERAYLMNLETKIEQLEEKLTALEIEMSDPDNYTDHAASRDMALRYQALREKIDALYKEWEDAST